MPVKLICRPNRPHLIEEAGEVEVYDTTGNKVDTSARPRIALCRCGQSAGKPFCDGTHTTFSFQG